MSTEALPTEPPYDVNQKCRVCGCTNESACVWDSQPLDGGGVGSIKWEGCEWVEYDLCSCHATPGRCDRVDAHSSPETGGPDRARELIAGERRSEEEAARRRRQRIWSRAARRGQ